MTKDLDTSNKSPIIISGFIARIVRIVKNCFWASGKFAEKKFKQLLPFELMVQIEVFNGIIRIIVR